MCKTLIPDFLGKCEDFWIFGVVLGVTKKGEEKRKRLRLGLYEIGFSLPDMFYLWLKPGGGRIRLPATSPCYYKAELSASIYYLPLPVKNSGLGKIEYLNTDTAGVFRLNMTPQTIKTPDTLIPRRKGPLNFKPSKQGAPASSGLGLPIRSQEPPDKGLWGKSNQSWPRTKYRINNAAQRYANYE